MTTDTLETDAHKLTKIKQLLFELLSTHYAHEVVIGRYTQSAEAPEYEKVHAYYLECLECDKELIYIPTNERE
jgi:hypothetical protein